MVPFAGFSMPLLYGKSGQGQVSYHFSTSSQWVDMNNRAVSSHKYVRDHVGLFDVGHMVQSLLDTILLSYYSGINLPPLFVSALLAPLRVDSWNGSRRLHCLLLRPLAPPSRFFSMNKAGLSTILSYASIQRINFTS